MAHHSGMELQSAHLLAGHAHAADAPRISTICLRALVEAAEVFGVSAQELLGRAGIAPELLARPHEWVAPSAFDQLASHAVELTGDPAFGLHWAERSPMMKFELLPMLATHAATLREALRCVVRFQSVLWKPAVAEVVERPDVVLLRVFPQATTELGARVHAELAIMGLARLFRYLGAPHDALRGAVAFAYPAPAYANEYARAFGHAVRFTHGYSEIQFSASWADRHLERRNTELHQVLTLQAQHFLERAKTGSGYAGRVREYVRSVFPQQPEMAQIARAMAMSVRSLRRRLADEGCTYSEILQESRLVLARTLLANDPTRSIKQIGYDVGFARTSTFYRAFKRWTGESPAAFRSGNQRIEPSMACIEVSPGQKSPEPHRPRPLPSWTPS